MKQQIIRTMRRIYTKQLTTATGGNISIKDKDNGIWITPSGIDKGSLSEEDIVLVKGGYTVTGKHEPSVELPFHQAIYDKRNDVTAVIHAHPPALAAYSIARKVPDTSVTPVTRNICGDIASIPFGVSGTDELAEEVGKCFEKGHTCAILENHGIVVGGTDLHHAFILLETLEYCAEVSLNSTFLGKTYTCGLNDRETFKPIADIHRKNPDRYTAEKTGIAELMRRTYRQNLCISTTGLFSVRVDGMSFLATDDTVDRGEMEAEDVMLIQRANENIGTPNRRVALLRSIYAKQSDVSAVIIAQPPSIMSFAAAHKPIDTELLPESHVIVRSIPLLPEKTLKTPEKLADRLSRKSPSALIENTGIVIVGKDLLQCFNRLEITEFAARSILMCLRFAEPKGIAPRYLKELEDRFLQFFM